MILVLEGGLYYYVMNPSDVKTKNEVTQYSFYSTVNSNKEFFTNQEIKQADKARDAMRSIACPGINSYKSYVANNLLKNPSFTVDDINQAETIYGPAIPLLQSKMTRPTPPVPQLHKRVPLPLLVSKHHSAVDLAIDFFWVHGLIFLHTKSRKLNFCMASLVSSRSFAQIMQNLKLVFNVYKIRGFKIRSVTGDDEFDIQELHPAVAEAGTAEAPAVLNIVGAGAHVGFIEEDIRVIKERARCITCALPFTFYPKIMIRFLIKWILRNLNAFPSKNSVSDSMGPSMIVCGTPHIDLSVPLLPFGTFVMAFLKSDNTNEEHSTPAIALCPSNEHGGHHFMNIATGAKIHAFYWKELPISDEMVEAVNKIGRDQGIPSFNDKILRFSWKPNHPIIDADLNNDDELIEANNEDNNNDDDDQNDVVLPINDELQMHHGEPVLFDDQYNININDPEAFLYENQDDEENEETHNNGVNETPINDEDDDSSYHTVASSLDDNLSDYIDKSSTSSEEASVNENDTSFSDGSDKDKDISFSDVSEAFPSDDSRANMDNDENSTTAQQNPPRRTARPGAGSGVSRIVMTQKGKSHQEEKKSQYMQFQNPEHDKSYVKEKCKINKMDTIAEDIYGPTIQMDVPRPQSHFEVIERQFYQCVQEANEENQVLDASNLLRIAHEIMFVHLSCFKQISQNRL